MYPGGGLRDADARNDGRAVLATNGDFSLESFRFGIGILPYPLGKGISSGARKTAGMLCMGSVPL